MLLIILCGIPCSGKSQVAVRIAKELEFNYGLPTMVVDPDKIREMIPALSEHFNPGRESFANSLALTLIEKGLEHREIVISDDLNYFESTRHRLIQVARKHNAKHIIVYLMVSVEVAQNRNAARGTPVPQEVIVDIAKKFDRPGVKYQWDRPDLVLDSEKTDPEEAAKLVLQVALSRIKGARSGDEVSTSTPKLAQRGRRVQQALYKKALDDTTRRILNDLFISRKLDVRLSKDASKLRRAFLNEIDRERVNVKDAESEFKRRLKSLMRRRTQSAGGKS